MTLVFTPTVAGAQLTNTAVSYRTETDTNQANNAATLVLIPSYSVTSLYSEGIDTNVFNWRSRGGALWSIQTNVTHDGIDALQSGPITHGQYSYLETGIRGPATLKFWWKVSSENLADRLRFYTNGFSTVSITGSQNWQQYSYSVPAAYVSVIWGYTKDADISAGSDAGWVDQIVLEVPVFELSVTGITNDVISLEVLGTNGQRLVLEGSNNLQAWTSLNTNIVTGGKISYTDIQSANFLYRFYRAVHRNEP